MKQERIKYRKLPGRRRGFLFGSSVWLGPDHLLLVKSARFREEYKRFYFRDIQSIVTAETPRFHISTRSAFIGIVLATALIAGINPRVSSAVEWALSLIALLLIAVWIYVSTAASCRTRIYTAVSSDELPSVYRTRTARRFLAAVQPHIVQAQGVLEGNWAEAVEGKQVGPLPEGRVGLNMPGLEGAAAMQSSSLAAPNTPISNFFVGSLCAGGMAELVTIRASGQAGRWILLVTLLVQLVAAVSVLIQTYRGKLRPAMRNLAITSLIAMGAWYYVVQVGGSMAIGYQVSAQRSNPKVYAPQQQEWALFQYPWARGSAGALTLLLGLAGVILSLRGERPAEERVSFNV
jgi:hypothetical protein